MAERSAARGPEAGQRYAAAPAMARARGFRPLEALARLALGRVHARAELGMTRWLLAVEASRC